MTGALNVLEMCRKFGVKKFVLASTSSLYGKEHPTPYREDMNTDHQLSPYAATKKAAEAMAYTYHFLHEIDVSVLRYFTVYGPAGRPDMTPLRFTQRIREGRDDHDFRRRHAVARLHLRGRYRAGRSRRCGRSATRRSISARTSRWR